MVTLRVSRHSLGSLHPLNAFRSWGSAKGGSADPSSEQFLHRFYQRTSLIQCRRKLFVYFYFFFHVYDFQFLLFARFLP